ncbi:MAG: fructose-6-phosphate aldolase [Dehalococcoidia bacterium]|nr:fructose-6-phosphate aldolase [Dehalococcoidia bacterium]
MRIFLDTANLDEIRYGARLGVVSGITTNPSLVAKEGTSDYRTRVLEICRLIEGPISAEVVSTDVRAMLEEGRRIASWHPNVVVKIPSTEEGFEAISTLSKEGIRINQTLCFSVNQALLGAQAGSSYVSPFVGRLDDAGHDGMAVVADIVAVYQHYGITTQVLAASLRHPLHVVAAAKAGAHIATIPHKVLMAMVKHPLTDLGLAAFLKDWNAVAKAPLARVG